MNVIVFLLIAGSASARHVLDVQFNTHDNNGDVVIERRNIGYISTNTENTPYINSDFRQAEKSIRIKTNERFVESTVKYNEDNHENSLNNISYDVNVHKLRTNAYTTEAYSTTEYVVQDVKVYTNKKEPKYIADRNLDNRSVITNQGDQKYNQNVALNQSNKPRLRPQNRPAINNNQENRRPETSMNIPSQNPQNERTDIDINHSKEPANVQGTVLIQPIPTEETRNRTESLPNTDTDDQIWVWGTEQAITEPGSLDDRAAFSGDKCPTGQAKVKGICVETH